MKIKIIGELPDLNTEISNAKKHWSYYSKTKKRYTTDIAWQCKGFGKVKTPCYIDFHWIVKNKRKDPDNIAFAKKYILDGLVEAQIIPNDSLKYILGFSDTFGVGDPSVIVSFR
jgi:Holliday junction resolvase RusA-like endonuclease